MTQWVTKTKKKPTLDYLSKFYCQRDLEFAIKWKGQFCNQNNIE